MVSPAPARPAHHDDPDPRSPRGHEALWLGAWLDADVTAMASVTLTDSTSGYCATIVPPGDFQIAGLDAQEELVAQVGRAVDALAPLDTGSMSASMPTPAATANDS